MIWVQDYQLALVPCFIRQERPGARIAFFWHIPFPSPEVFLTLPWREQLIDSLLACDLIGFHIPAYTENFIQTAVALFGAEASGSTICYKGRTVRILARPIGIDYQELACGAQSKRTERRVSELRESLSGQTIILGVERMDYTKGILERLRAFERLLEQKPELRGTVTFIQLVTPSRELVEAYRDIKRELDEMVGRINGKFSDGIWMPIRYQYHSFSPTELIAYYRAADVALVTPLRDGLNLIAKEYVATRIHGDGVLILSEFAGVAQQLREALIVNPYNLEGMASALAQALAMSKEEQRARMEAMQARIQQQDITWWANEFLQRMSQI